MRKAVSESASFFNLSPEYFFAADRRDIYIIKGIKIWGSISVSGQPPTYPSKFDSFHQFTFRSKEVHSEDHFSEEGFSWESIFKVKFQYKCRAMQQWTNYADKNYANLWFILLQVTKGFTFQKDKNVRFISGNFSSERFSWKLKTIRCGLYISIHKHLWCRCLEFTILKRTWPINRPINFSLVFRIKTFCLRSSQMIMKQN